jgi:hypothetical protein
VSFYWYGKMVGVWKHCLDEVRMWLFDCTDTQEVSNTSNTMPAMPPQSQQQNTHFKASYQVSEFAISELRHSLKRFSNNS